MSNARVLGLPNKAKTDTEKLQSGNNGWAGINTFSYLNIPIVRPGSPVAGSCYFDPAGPTFYCYTGSAWKSVGLV